MTRKARGAEILGLHFALAFQIAYNPSPSGRSAAW